MSALRGIARRYAVLSVAITGLFCAGSALAATVSVPNANGTGVESSGSSGLNTPIRNAARSYEVYYAANNFSSITQPVMITGMQMRMAIGENWRPAGYVGQTWPDASITFPRWDLQLSTPSAGLVSDGEYLSTTPTFASYQGADVTTVKSGPLTIAANSFAADGANPATDVHSYGATITFSTPYAYTPGNGMVALLRLQGYTPTTVLQAFVGSTNFLNGTTDAISNTTGDTAAAPNGFSSPIYIQFTYGTNAPEPASMSVIALAGLAMLKRRR